MGRELAVNGELQVVSDHLGEAEDQPEGRDALGLLEEEGGDLRGPLEPPKARASLDEVLVAVLCEDGSVAVGALVERVGEANEVALAPAERFDGLLVLGTGIEDEAVPALRGGRRSVVPATTPCGPARSWGSIHGRAIGAAPFTEHQRVSVVVHSGCRRGRPCTDPEH